MTAPVETKTRRVLVVEDEPDIRESLKDLLEAAVRDVEVTTAASGREALGILPRLSPHLIISDHKMPGITGLDLLGAARATAPGTARVLMTAFPDVDVALEAINEAHIEAYFQKPLDTGLVVEKVGELLDRQQERHRRERSMARVLGRAAGGQG